MTEVQRSFNPSILEGLVTSAADIRACNITGSNQPSKAFGFEKHMAVD